MEIKPSLLCRETKYLHIFGVVNNFFIQISMWKKCFYYKFMKLYNLVSNRKTNSTLLGYIYFMSYSPGGGGGRPNFRSMSDLNQPTVYGGGCPGGSCGM